MYYNNFRVGGVLEGGIEAVVGIKVQNEGDYEVTGRDPITQLIIQIRLIRAMLPRV